MEIKLSAGIFTGCDLDIQWRYADQMKVDSYHYPFADKSFPFNMNSGKTRSGDFKKAYHLHSDAIEIQYVRSGSGNYFIRNRTYHFSEKSILLIHGRDVHTFFPDSSRSEIDKTALIFSKRLFDGIPQSRAIVGQVAACGSSTSHKITLDEETALKVEFLVAMLEKEWATRQASYKDAITGGLWQLLVLIRRNLSSAGRLKELKTENHHIIDKALRWIDSRFREPVTLLELSRHVCYSPFHVSHVLKESTGFTFHEHLTQRRIIESKRMLESEKDMKIITVSCESGFRDLSVFNRTFKKVTGTSPSKYRKFCISFRK